MARRVAIASKITPEAARELYQLVEQRRAQDPRGRATRSSVAAELLERALECRVTLPESAARPESGADSTLPAAPLSWAEKPLHG